MTNIERPLDFPDRSVARAHRLPSAAAMRTAFLVAVLIACGLGFAALNPLLQTSVAESAADGGNSTFLLSP
jgi:hypothetical protein